MLCDLFPRNSKLPSPAIIKTILFSKYNVFDLQTSKYLNKYESREKIPAKTNSSHVLTVLNVQMNDKNFFFF